MSRVKMNSNRFFILENVTGCAKRQHKDSEEQQGVYQAILLLAVVVDVVAAAWPSRLGLNQALLRRPYRGLLAPSQTLAMQSRAAMPCGPHISYGMPYGPSRAMLPCHMGHTVFSITIWRFGRTILRPFQDRFEPSLIKFRMKVMRHRG
jgi:hypothetical protein